MKTFYFNESENKNFNNLLKAVDNNLKKAIFPFANYFETDIINFLSAMKYDYTSLQVTTVYNVLNLLSIGYAEELQQSKIKKAMPYIKGDMHSTSEDRNRKRVERIRNDYDGRNKKNLDYFRFSHSTPKTLATDALWYDLLSEFPILKRFLFEEEAIITKSFFDELNLAYEKINEESGYDRFYLLYKLEMSSKLELFYKILSLIKKEKRRLKLIDKDVQNLINKMQYLHKVPLSIPSEYIKECNLENNDVYEEILWCFSEWQTTNNIIFNVDSLASEYVKGVSTTISVIRILNHILYATVFHLTNHLTEEISCLENIDGFDFVNKLQHCTDSTAYFNDYICSHNLVNTKKNYTEDITFQHFKKIYNLKKYL